MASLYQVTGNLPSAERLLQEVLQIQRAERGACVDLVPTLQELAEVYCQQGRVEEAEPLYTQTVEMQRQRVGEQHADFAQALQSLARFYLRQNNLAAAEVRIQQALKIRAAVQGEDHPDYAQALEDLATVHHQAGNLAATEALYQQCLELRREHLGEQHPDFARSLHQLALVYQATERFTEAEPLFRQALDLLRDDPGEEHPSYLQALHNQALFFQAQGDYPRAESTLRRVADLTQRLFGEKGCALVPVLTDLAWLYMALGDHLAAEPLLLRVQEINQVNQHHPVVAATDLGNQARLYRELGEYSQAESLARQALEQIRAAFGDDHPEVAAGLSFLASLHQARAEYPQAEALCLQALDIGRASLGKLHPSVAGWLHELASLKEQQGRFSEATALHREALGIIRKAVGSDNLDYLNGLRLLAACYQSQGEYKAAEPLLSERLQIMRRLFGEDHLLLVPGILLLAELHVARRDFPAAEKVCRQAHELVRKPVPGDERLRASVLHQMTYLYLIQGQWTKAEPLLRQLMPLTRRVLGEDHPAHCNNLYQLALVCAATGREAEALMLLEQLTKVEDQVLPQLLALPSDRVRVLAYHPIHESHGAYLSLVRQSLGGAPGAAEMALDLVLRRKLVWIEALAPSRLPVLQAKYPALRAPLRKLFLLDRQIASKRWGGPGPEGPETHQRLLSDWLDQRNQLATELGKQVHELDLQAKLRGVDRRAVAQALPAGSTLIEFVWLPEWDFRDPLSPVEQTGVQGRYLAFVLAAGESDQVRMIDLGPAGPVDRLIADFRRRLHDRGPADALRAVGPALRAAIWDPVAPALGGREHLVLAPDSELVHVPFAALPLNDGRHLIDQYTISHVNTGRDVLRWNQLRGDTSTAPVVAGDPAFDEPVASSAAATAARAARSSGRRERSFWSAVRQFLTLRWLRPAATTTASKQRAPFRRDVASRAEVESVAGLLGVEPLVGNQVGSSRLQACRSPHVLHLAVPVFFTEEAPQDSTARDQQTSPSWVNPLRRSGLALTGANHWLANGVLTEGSQGMLLACDIAQLDLVATEVVAVSGSVSPPVGECVGPVALSLRDAFAQAGAETLVLGLWKVPDRQASEFWECFYRGLRDDQPRADALRAAMLALKARQPDSPHWGAFLCQGDPTPLKSAITCG